ncbi:MAG: right-handed parallel beta-helix repeat-containing protein [Candidatus Hodarchaeales archaeon]
MINIRAQRIIVIMALICMVLYLTPSSAVIVNQIPSEQEKLTNGEKLAFYPHSAINIDGNRELIEQANAEGWSGRGTQQDPYIIEGLNITYNGDTLFSLRSTDLFLEIRNCLFHEGIYYGLFFRNVSNVRLISNTVHGCNPYGIYILSTRNILLEDNTVYNNSRDGLFVYSSSDVLIRNNCIIKNQEDAIHVTTCQNTTLTGNELFSNQNGIFSEFCTNTIISGNTITNNTRTGLYTFYSWDVDYIDNEMLYNGFSGFSCIESHHIQILNNTASKNTMSGLVLLTTDNSQLENNLIEENHQSGIVIVTSVNNTVTGNVMIANLDFGIFLKEADETAVTWNNFTDNNPGGVSQASDGGENNTFHHNYWNEWTGPDEDGNGIVDIEYTIEGDPGNTDPFPISKANETEITTSNTFSRVSGFIINELMETIVAIAVLNRIARFKKRKTRCYRL